MSMHEQLREHWPVSLSDYESSALLTEWDAAKAQLLKLAAERDRISELHAESQQEIDVLRMALARIFAVERGSSGFDAALKMAHDALRGPAA